MTTFMTTSEVMFEEIRPGLVGIARIDSVKCFREALVKKREKPDQVGEAQLFHHCSA